MGRIQIWQHIFFLARSILKYIRVFQWLSKSKVLSFMTKANPNNGNETKVDISMWHIQIWHYFSLALKYWNISMAFVIGSFQFYSKSEHKQVKWNKITWEICKSDSIFPYLQSSTLFNLLLKFISWSLSKKWMITFTKENCPSFNFIS